MATGVWNVKNIEVDVISWLLKIAGSEIKVSLQTRDMAIFLSNLFCEHGHLIEYLRHLDPSLPISSMRSPDGYTALHYQIAGGCLAVSRNFIEVADLHTLGHDPFYSSDWETPTSLVLYSIWSFLRWRVALEDIGTDFKRFAFQETQKGRLYDIGFKEVTLRHLFTENCEHPYNEWPSNPACSDCNSFYLLVVQPHWQMMIMQLNAKMEPDDVRDNESKSSEREDSMDRQVWSTESAQEQSSTNPTRSEAGQSLDPRAEMKSDTSRYPFNLKDVEFECPYDLNDLVCMDCWLHFQKQGHRRGKLLTTEEDISDEEDDFSPFRVHT